MLAGYQWKSFGTDAHAPTVAFSWSKTDCVLRCGGGAMIILPDTWGSSFTMPVTTAAYGTRSWTSPLLQVLDKSSTWCANVKTFQPHVRGFSKCGCSHYHFGLLNFCRSSWYHANHQNTWSSLFWQTVHPLCELRGHSTWSRSNPGVAEGWVCGLHTLSLQHAVGLQNLGFVLEPQRPAVQHLRHPVLDLLWSPRSKVLHRTQAQSHQYPPGGASMSLQQTGGSPPVSSSYPL